MNIDWKKAIGFGVVIWVLMFVIVSIFIAFNVYGNAVAKVVAACLAGAISYFLAAKIKPADIKIALTYGVIWVIVGVILDAVISTRFNALIFSSKGLWLGYLLVLLAPLFTVKKGSGAPISTPPSTPSAGQ
jgi:hypothetical protein